MSIILGFFCDARIITQDIAGCSFPRDTSASQTDMGSDNEDAIEIKESER